MYDAVFIEEMGKPAVPLINHSFANDAMSAASQKGMPGLRFVTTSVPSSCSIAEDIEAGVSKAMDAIVAALTKPLTKEEKSPKRKEVEKLSRIVFKGNLKDVNRFFYKRGWTDGLPIIPPTEEEVAEMLTGTDLPPDHVVVKVMPRLGKATIEKIAINAVMAGALPTYMPLLIAGLQALVEPKSSYHFMHASGSAQSPFWIVNGPIRNALHINSGLGALSPGDIANATIGRALALMIRTIGGSRKGIEEMGCVGTPGKYTMVTAENEEETPWEPLHVEYGFDKEDSTISVSFVQTTQRELPHGSDDGAILSAVVHMIRASGTIRQGVTDGTAYVVLPPAAAKYLASSGLTKKELVSLIQKISGPLGPLQEASRSSGLPGLQCVQLLVQGGASFSNVSVLRGAGSIVTKKVELPANWDKLVAKYDDIVPTYVRY